MRQCWPLAGLLPEIGRRGRPPLADRFTILRCYTKRACLRWRGQQAWHCHLFRSARGSPARCSSSLAASRTRSVDASQSPLAHASDRVRTASISSLADCRQPASADRKCVRTFNRPRVDGTSSHPCPDHCTLSIIGFPASPTWNTRISRSSVALKFLPTMAMLISSGYRSPALKVLTPLSSSMVSSPSRT